MEERPRKIGARAVAGLALAGLAIVVALRDTAPRKTQDGGEPALASLASSEPVAEHDLVRAPRAEPVEERAPAARAAVVVPETARGTQTARQYLAGWYGAEWPAIEARMEAERLDLDVPYVPTPWEDVAGEFEGRVGNTPSARANLVKSWVSWSEPLTPEFLAQNFRVPAPHRFDAADVASIEAIVADSNVAIRERAEYLASLIDELARLEWETGQYVKAPFTTAGLDTPHGFFAQSTGGHGWAVSITLTHDEYPEFAAVQETMHELRDERDVKVAGYLRDKYGK